jgi:excisionase family DNA binding protein
MDSFEKMYSVKEVAYVTGWSPDTIRRLIYRGYLKATMLPRSGRRKRIYRSTRIPASEVKKLTQPDQTWVLGEAAQSPPHLFLSAQLASLRQPIRLQLGGEIPTVNVSVPYQISQDEALSRIQARIAQIKTQYSSKVSDLRENWSGNVGTFSGSARGFSVSGSLVVNPSVVTVELALPLIAFVYKGQIEAGIRNELTSLLAWMCGFGTDSTRRVSSMRGQRS